MCGITGIIGTASIVTADRLSTLARALAHRGPDDEGSEIFPVQAQGDRVVGFAHRRLAIIDLSPAGHQPMRDAVTGNWVTFNGEIYNYEMLRSELAALGHIFQTSGDTEVILKAYAQWGVSCVERFRGMFAFALWDVAAQKVFFVVDRLGIKPLYIARHDHGLVFASELRAIMQSGIVPRIVDPHAVASFLAFGAVQAPRTMIAGVEMLCPAEYALYDVATGAFERATYWRPHASHDDRPLSEVLAEAVQLHLVSDVPVGLFLSGGVDSSALAILAHRLVGKKLDSFSVTFVEGAYAEGEYARIIGERFCARHHEITLSASDCAELLPDALAAMDQPTIDGVNAFVISKAVRAQGIKVVLSGQGGDEVFGGYPTFRRLPRMRTWAPFARYAPASLARIAPEGAVREKLAAYLASDGSWDGLYAIARQLFSPRQVQGLISERPRPHPSPLLQGEGDDAFSAVSRLELRGYLANMLLRDGDVMSMAHGLEVRVPYLDHVLIERVFAESAAAKQSRTIPKPLLVRAVLPELPRAIYDRKKMGFTFPWEEWLRGPLRARIDATLADTDAAAAVGLSLPACTALWSSFLSRRNGVTWSRVWATFVLLRWARRHLL